MKTKINIIGRGNVATHLYKAFKQYISVNSINPHTLDNIDVNADLTIISVSDDAIKSVVNHLPKLKGIVAHTSGSTGIDIFKDSHILKYGVFYPLQTFSKDKDLNYSKIPFFIEASDKETERELLNLASLVSNNVRIANSKQRKKLHIASVFSCNFVNHLWALSDRYLRQNDLSFSDLIPLIEETLEKTSFISPEEAQTGPAVREDMNIIASHIDDLDDNPTLQNIYK
ncbi:MAG: DUF2520 domain-containing protein, partial [Muribaculaceae bacterium]|nr:DUF2520 domain-containing protein [Muribaculaceae bacterium]